MRHGVWKNQPYHYGSYNLTGSKSSVLSNTWKVHQKISDCFYVLYRYQKDRIVYAPLYIYSFRFLNNRHLTKAQVFLHDNLDPEMLASVSDKLKWYRIYNGLLQRDVAKIMGVDRTTYSHYEENILDSYPLDKLSKAAELFGIDVTTLLDDYNLFLYHGQGKQIKELRKKLKLTQFQFSEYLGIPIATLKNWEQNRGCIQKKTFQKLFQLQNTLNNV